ncbi:MAG: hypothetical protein N3A53_01595, partial [Verrucomicrobiae bacterium]|nr:hypothetical protein [Verrucomicrobiae bacterium]
MEKTEAVGGGLIVPSWPEFREPKFDVQPWHGALRDDISGEPAWYGYANPSDAQKKPSCGGHAAA